MKADMNLNFAY